VIVVEFHELLKRLARAIAAVQEQTEQYDLFLQAGSYESSAQAKSLIYVALRAAYETTEEIEIVLEMPDIEPSLQEIGLLVVLGERLREAQALLSEHVELASTTDDNAKGKFVVVDN
jgi:hypothetical protein